MPVLHAQALTEQIDPILRRAGYTPCASLQLSSDLAALTRPFVEETSALWMGEPWGSISFFGVRQADALDEAAISSLIDRFFAAAQDLLPFTGQLVFHGGLGPAVRLGVFGRLLLVWESTPRVAVARVRSIKRIQWLKKCHVVPWAAVLPERRAYGHRGLPFTMGAPAVQEIQRLLTE